MKSKKWQTHRSRKKSENSKRVNPSQYSTGPKTDVGKQNSSQNALKNGAYTADMLALIGALHKQSRWVQAMSERVDVY